MLRALGERCDLLGLSSPAVFGGGLLFRLINFMEFGYLMTLTWNCSDLMMLSFGLRSRSWFFDFIERLLDAPVTTCACLRDFDRAVSGAFL